MKSRQRLDVLLVSLYFARQILSGSVSYSPSTSTCTKLIAFNVMFTFDVCIWVCAQMPEQDYFHEMFDVYIQGHENRIAQRAYPQSVNCPHGDLITLHLNPMVCTHLKKDIDVKYLNGVKLTQEMLKGKHISYICLILCIELKRQGKFCKTKTKYCT